MAQRKPGNRTVIYARASSARQETSTDDQIQICRMWLERNAPNLAVTTHLADNDVSGFYVDLKDRDRGEELLAMATNREFDVLVVYELSRLSRDTLQGLTILDDLVTRNRIHVISVADGIDTRESYDKSEIAGLFLRSRQESERMSKRIRSRMDLIKFSIAQKGHYVTKSGSKITHLGMRKGTPDNPVEFNPNTAIGRWRTRKAWLLSIAPRLISAARSDVFEHGRAKATWTGMAERLNFEGLRFENHHSPDARHFWDNQRVSEAVRNLKRLGAWEEAWLSREFMNSHSLDQTVALRDWHGMRRHALEGLLH